MKYAELTEDAPPKDIRNLIQSIALSLIGSGRTEVHTQNLANEIKKRTGIDVPYGVLMDILNELPFIQDVNSDIVTLSGNDSDGTTDANENSGEKVEDMAMKSASSSDETF